MSEIQYFPVALLDADSYKEFQENNRVNLDDVAFAYWDQPCTSLTFVDHKNCQTFDIKLPEGWDGKPIQVVYDEKTFDYIPATGEEKNILTLVYDKEGYAPKWIDEIDGIEMR
jgi:hypothetical protein